MVGNDQNTESNEEVGSVYAPWIHEVDGDATDQENSARIGEIEGGLQGASSSNVATIQHLIPHSIMDFKKIGHRVKSYDEFQSFPETYMLSDIQVRLLTIFSVCFL